MYNIQYIH